MTSNTFPAGESRLATHLFVTIIALSLCGIFLAGCLSDQTRENVGNSAQVIYNAAASLPASPQVTAIQANATAIGVAVGKEVTP